MRLRKERQKAGLTQQELSRLSRVPQSTVSKLETAHARVRPSAETLARLAWALNKFGANVSVADLLPTRQPALIKGFRSERKRKRTA